MAAVETRGLVKRFGAFTALERLDLSVEAGEFVALLGPSGCGKSTTLRMLAGLDFPTSGEIRIGGRMVNDLAPGKRDVAMVFQSYALYPHMTVAQNIAYPLRKRGVPRAERAAAVSRAAELLQLGPLLDRRPAHLSGGQQQRVALGRALVREPQVFLLDEPLSNLDAKLRGHMRAELIELHARLGRTMIHVTHDQLEAMTMAGRIAVMHEGRLRQFDTPGAVYDRPADRFVAGFIGQPAMNQIEGEIVGSVFRFGGHSVPIDRAGLVGGVENGPVVLGVRPEFVRPIQPGAREGGLSATVRLVENAGHEQIVTLELDGGPRLLSRVEPGRRLDGGRRVEVALEPHALHLFAPDEDGRRLNDDRARVIPARPQAG